MMEMKYMMSFSIILSIRVDKINPNKKIIRCFFKILENHEKLEKSVLSYPIGTEISIEFFNMNFKANKRDLETFFLRDYPQSALNKNLIKSITIDMQELNPYYKKGTGRMITNNRDFALFCVKKNGEVNLFI